MPGPVTTALGKTAKHVPGLKRIPVLKLIALGELVLIAHAHLGKLEPGERRRLFELVRTGRGRPSNLSDPDRRELRDLIAKVEPRLLAGTAVDKLSPVPLPGRVLYGPSPRAKARKAKRSKKQ